MNIKLRNLVAATLAGTALLGFGANAMADTTDDIVNALMAKGILTEEEGALLMNGRQLEKSTQAKTPAPKLKDGAISLETPDGKNSIAVTGRIQFDYRNSDIDEFSTVNEGRTTAFSRDTDTSSGADQFEIRRARIGVKGKLYEHFDYEVITNLVGGSANLVDVAYINAGMFKPVQLRIGQFKQPFNLEEFGTSSNNIDFQERAFINQITPGKKPGLMVHGLPFTGVTYAGSYYQQNTFGETDSQSDGKGFAGRATINFAEIKGWKESVFHLGLAGFDSEYGLTPATSGNTSTAASNQTRGTIFGFRSGGRGLNNIYRAQIGGDSTVATCATAPGAAAANGCLINTTAVGLGYGVASSTAAEVENKAYGLEAIAAIGPFKLQGEYMNSQFEANHQNTGNRVEADVNTFYAEALWMITGEKYADAYKAGGWSSIKPITPFDIETGKGKGAWEIGIRYDEFEVEDTLISAGTNTNSRFQGSVNNLNPANFNTATGTTGNGGAKTYTAGIKWILNPNMRVLLNYAHTKFDTAFKPIDVQAQAANNNSVDRVDSEDIISVRTQLSF